MQNIPKPYAALFAAVDRLVQAHKDIETGLREGSRDIKKMGDAAAKAMSVVRDEYEKLTG